ncbi:hypothetical protein [Glycomyces albidus]|nr:hypothetical protein [Glycomyces albidus]
MMTWILRNIGIAIGMALVRYVLRVAKRRRAQRLNRAASSGPPV